jgi:hypothetical protein
MESCVYKRNYQIVCHQESCWQRIRPLGEQASYFLIHRTTIVKNTTLFVFVGIGSTSPNPSLASTSIQLFLPPYPLYFIVGLWLIRPFIMGDIFVGCKTANGPLKSSSHFIVPNSLAVGTTAGEFPGWHLLNPLQFLYSQDLSLIPYSYLNDRTLGIDATVVRQNMCPW